MTSKSEVAIRRYRPEDSVRCREMFVKGFGEIFLPIMKIIYPEFLKVTFIFLVIVTAIAVKWSSTVWIFLVLYFAVFVLMTATTYVYIYVVVMLDFINDSLKTDLLDIGKYYAGDSCMFVAECGGRVIGMVAVDIKEQHKPGVAKLRRMSVCKSSRRKGVGKLLVNKVVEYCKEKKYNKIILKTGIYRQGAIAFYKKCGFKYVESQIWFQYFRYGVDDFFFERDLQIED